MSIDYANAKDNTIMSEPPPMSLPKLMEAMNNKISALAEMVSMIETTCAYVSNDIDETNECEIKPTLYSMSPAGRMVENAIIDIETQIHRLDRLHKRLTL